MKEKEYKRKERTSLFLGMVEEKVYCKRVGEHNEMQGYLEESKLVITRLNWAMCKRGRGREKRERGEGNHG